MTLFVVLFSWAAFCLFSRSWVRIPTSSSSTLWLIPEKRSMSIGYVLYILHMNIWICGFSRTTKKNFEAMNDSNKRKSLSALWSVPEKWFQDVIQNYRRVQKGGKNISNDQKRCQKQRDPCTHGLSRINPQQWNDDSQQKRCDWFFEKRRDINEHCGFPN